MKTEKLRPLLEKPLITSKLKNEKTIIANFPITSSTKVSLNAIAIHKFYFFG